MVTVGLVLIVVGVLVGLYFALKAFSNFRGAVRDPNRIREAVGNHFGLAQRVAVCGATVFLGIVFLVVGLVQGP